MIVATAGHIDHGKTLLIKALTGQDTDRLPEEKARGMTIDLGFAYLPIADGQVAGSAAIGFIDAPGHERFIRNMLAGVAAIDFVLLVIAADDGPMPQTRAHLEILDLLEVRHGAVVMSKVDRVSAERVAEASREARELIAGTTLATAKFFEVSAATGLGIDALRAHLLAFGSSLPPRKASGHFRLPIDRSFTLRGAGLVVTGSAVSGSLTVGGDVELLESRQVVRARSIHAQNRATDACRAGQRCAISLSGGARAGEIRRGDWAVDPRVARPVDRIDVCLRVLPTERRALAHWTPVHVHIGTSAVMGRVLTLEGASFEPGQSALAQILTERPVGALCGDRFVLRSNSSDRNLAGGHVLDIFPPARGRARAERLAYLRAMEADDHVEALRGAMAATPAGVDLPKFLASRNITEPEAAVLLKSAQVIQVPGAKGTLAFSRSRWEELSRGVVTTLDAWHRQHPDSIGPPVDRVLDASALRLSRDAVIAIGDELARRGEVVKTGFGVRLPQHRPRMSAPDELLWQRMQKHFPTNSTRPPTVAELATSMRESERAVESVLSKAARLGLIGRVSPKRYLGFTALRALAEVLESLAPLANDGLVDAARFRDRAGISRNLAIEVLEFFDRIRFTRRIGNGRRVLRPAREAFADEAPHAGGTSRGPMN